LEVPELGLSIFVLQKQFYLY